MSQWDAAAAIAEIDDGKCISSILHSKAVRFPISYYISPTSEAVSAVSFLLGTHLKLKGDNKKSLQHHTDVFKDRNSSHTCFNSFFIGKISVTKY